MSKNTKKISWRRKLLTLTLAGGLGFQLIPLSAQAASEYTALGIGTYDNLNDLDNGDYYEFVNRMNGAGWTKTGAFTDSLVYYTDMTKYGNESDILYITGHGGSNGDIALKEYNWGNFHGLRSYVNYHHVGNTGQLSGGNPDGAGQDAEWFIFASCESLDQKYWARQVSDGVHYLFGYRGLSSDYTDTSIINQFLDRAWGSGWRSAETVYSSWINANRAYGEHDWSIIGHQNNRMDYLHGIESGLTPDQTSNSDVKRWSGLGSSSSITTEDLSYYAKNINDIETSDSEMELLEGKYKQKIKTKREKIKIKDIKESLLGVKVQGGFDNESKTSVFSSENGNLEVFKDNSFIFSREINNEEISKSQNEVLDEVKTFIDNNGGMREDISLYQIMPMSEEDPDGNMITTGYTILFKQKIDDTIIDGEIANGITIGYDSRGVNFYMRDIKDVELKEKIKNKKMKNPKEALRIAKESDITKFKSSDIEFSKLSLVYYAKPFNKNDNELVPAYKISVNDTNHVYIDAVSGDVLHGGKMIQDEMGINQTKANDDSETFKENHVIQQFDNEE